MAECWWRQAWLARYILVRQRWADGTQVLGVEVAKRLVLRQLERGAMGAVRFLPPRLMLMLVITHLAQLMKRRNVVNQAGQFSVRGPVHTVMQLSGFTRYGIKQTYKRSGLPHEWVLARP